LRLEHLPLLLGVLVGLLGIALIADAWMGDDMYQVRTERRRRIRAERHHLGEAIVGLGTLCMAAALLGRDTWRFGTLSVIIGTVLLIVGAIMNARFLKEALFFRGAARRGDMSGAERSEPGQWDAKPRDPRPAKGVGEGAAAVPEAVPAATPAAKPAPNLAPNPAPKAAPEPVSRAEKNTSAGARTEKRSQPRK
jgi:hypothetical protein